MATYEIYDKALELYLKKIHTGKYNDYSKEMLKVLFDDCVSQVITMNRLRGA